MGPLIILDATKLNDTQSWAPTLKILAKTMLIALAYLTGEWPCTLPTSLPYPYSTVFVRIKLAIYAKYKRQTCKISSTDQAWKIVFFPVMVRKVPRKVGKNLFRACFLSSKNAYHYFTHVLSFLCWLGVRRTKKKIKGRDFFL